MAHELDRTESAERQRDARLRQVMLRALAMAVVSPRGGLSGAALMQQVGGGALPGDEIEDEAHAVRLVRYLVGAGYASEKDTRGERYRRFGMATLFFAVTPKGSSLVDKRIPPDPMIDDERNLED